ncbi:DNA methyltransferase [Corynebacterium variabile]|uniref:site-specific DNA-methyltransferase (adenine-specific) n=1 Tax=Corynebacterium variabile TaxID=1727 RepID=A0A4Y4C5E1_9CORY|nr:DNA methyltransferase [Corynebacterium variabile]GEC86594.1 restriction endonuclease subunit M [Corynebacterium variabile]
MSTFDSIINVDEWLSDHYFTGEETKGRSSRTFGKRVTERVTEWKNADKAAEGTSPWVRLTAAHKDLQLDLSTLDADNPDSLKTTYATVARAFGYPADEKTLTFHRNEDAVTLPGRRTVSGAVLVLTAAPISAPEDLATAGLTDEVLLGDKAQSWHGAKVISELFLADDGPEFLLVLAGQWIVLAHRDGWPLGRYLAVDLGVAVERNDTSKAGELQRIVTILARENTDRAEDHSQWWEATMEEARQHSVQVSAGLRDAVRESIEIIGNDVLDRRRENHLPVECTDGPDGNELAKQSLRYLYRILFLLFAEATPELNILPTGTPEYDEGYGLARLRDQVLTEPVTDRARRGTHLYQSLQILFDMVNNGHDPADQSAAGYLKDAGNEGLVFRNLDADLFQPQATSLINEVQLSNLALHRILERLLLTREKSKKDRGFISYATLGVTELGQVYEGLMSYTGFIAEQDLLEVAPKGDASKGSWVVPVTMADDLPADSFVKATVETADGGEQLQNRKHTRGSFVFRQSSRDRERSASFYTPQVLTSFTVGQAIEVLQEEGRITCADDVLDLSICEPAMGSGAFAVEAVRQLADLYLDKKQEETGDLIESTDRTRQLQNVKASIALHQVYGVDLNKTAVELAEISLWLDTMTADLKAPWFGLHLRHGNSLIGSRRATVSANSVTKKDYLKEVPTEHGMDGVAKAVEDGSSDPAVAGRIHHFLLPSNGWGAAADAKDLKDIAGDEQKAMKEWRKSVRTGFTNAQQKQLAAASERVETLWRLALVRWRIAEDQARRDIDLWGQDEAEQSAKNTTRAEIEAGLYGNPDSPYQRLRLVMDAWNALWFWPLTETEALPSKEEWLAMLGDALGTPFKDTKAKTAGQTRLGYDLNWDELEGVDSQDHVFSRMMSTEDLLAAHPWLKVVQQVAAAQAFFHWDLDFAAVMSRGGFDLQVGNPPWVRPRTDLDALYAEHDPWFMLAHKPTQAAKRERRQQWSENPVVMSTVTNGISESVATADSLSEVTVYPYLRGQQPDLYRAFMETTWRHASHDGVVGLIHPGSHFTEKKAASLREGAYRRLRRHWQFINEMRLFDVHNLVSYGVHLYGHPQEGVSFLNAASLYHPQTVTDSLHHDGTGTLPGFKDDDNHWDLRPHRDRIIEVEEHELGVWNSILEEPGTPLLETRMVYTVNTEAAAVLEKLAAAPRMKQLGLQFSRGWDESIDKKKGYFDTEWKHPESWNDAILQGPHLGVSTPMSKQPNPTMSSNKDWSEVDFEAMPADFVPATAYQPDRIVKPTFDEDFSPWSAKGEIDQAQSYFRVGWRTMAATTGFRTIYPAIIPIGSSHLFTITSTASRNPEDTCAAGATLSSMSLDFFARSLGLSHLLSSTVSLFPMPKIRLSIRGTLILNYLRLNCLTEAYAPLWEDITGEKWTIDTPLRNAEARRAAQNEIDAIVALSLGVSADELCMIYRTQFPVMRFRYDEVDYFDKNGRKVPTEIAKLHEKRGGEKPLTLQERTWVHPQSQKMYFFEYPFRILDREADLRAAYAKYEPLLNQPE